MHKQLILGVALVCVVLAIYFQTLESKQDTEIASVSSKATSIDKNNANTLASVDQNIPETHQTPATMQSDVIKTFVQQRQQLLHQLKDIEDCENNGLCSVNEQDPKQVMFEQEAMLVKTLQQLQAMHQTKQVFDTTYADITGKYLTSPLGRVQMQAIDMLAQQPKNEANAEILISALRDSYDSKVMTKAMSVLAEYPAQQQQYENMLMQTLKTGSFYVSRTVAKEVRHILNGQNIAKFEALAASLPEKTAKAKLLKASIADFKRSQE
ncbi:hypothetical protein [Thalassotalea sediminis]|uniref:hypothetical protein n=1 Tax=Thalassotalea sediminis TaxID=1759089 RepID=UPI00257413A5|nr:hypothetical protein [Thalassotalea sediminis]